MPQRWLPSSSADAATAWLFPGQGTQEPGMGRALYEGSPAARQVFEAADHALGFSLSRLCFEGPAETLTSTDNAQPAIMTVSLACLAAALETGALRERPGAMAGHSLGEYTALVVAGALSFEDGVRLVRERGRLMLEAGQRTPGTLAAIIGLDLATIEAVCRETGAEVCNCNSPDQTVIGGAPDLVEKAMALARERGARRVAPLVVSGAFHTSLMQPAADGLRPTIDAAAIVDPVIPIIANGSAEPLTNVAAIRQELPFQMNHRVLWQSSMERLGRDGATSFIEIGPGRVLSGLVKRILPDALTRNINDAILSETSS